METETPEEKAKRLNIPFHKKVPQWPRKEKKEEPEKDALQKYLESTRKVQSICECGKEFKWPESGFKTSCGLQDCPFGQKYHES